MKMRGQIMDALSNSIKPMTFDEIADAVNLKKDAYVLVAELNNLTLVGSIQTIYKKYGGHLYCKKVGKQWVNN